MVLSDFTFSANQQVVFGIDSFQKLPDIIQRYGRRALLITGKQSFCATDHFTGLITRLTKQSISYYQASISKEPSPEMIDTIVNQHKANAIDLVVAIGGGSVIDAGKAISAMLLFDDPVVRYLEGVGDKTHSGIKVPFIAIPTTAGTGSEATKNAVLSQVGPNGFKKSLRHDRFIPDLALIDPALAVSCPPGVTAACGLDAFTQLLESYTSQKASVLTDALSYSGLSVMGDNLVKAVNKGHDLYARSAVAYGAYISGLTLANAGLGIVHGLASTIGGLVDIPHGVVCGTLLAPATEININYLKSDASEALHKYAQVGAMLSGKNDGDITTNCNRLIEILWQWQNDLKIPLLSDFGVDCSMIKQIAEKSSLKNNPAHLSKDQVEEILVRRINGK